MISPMAYSQSETPSGGDNSPGFGKSTNLLSIGLGLGGSYTYFGDGYTSTPNFVLTYDNGTFGNVKRNSLYGPGINTINFSAAKAFSIREGINVEFRADAQNVFNHPSFGLPDNTHLSGAAGVDQPYSGTAPIRKLTVQGRNLQLGLRVSF